MKIFSKNSLPLYIDKIINLIEKVLEKKFIRENSLNISKVGNNVDWNRFYLITRRDTVSFWWERETESICDFFRKGFFREL